MDKFQKRYMAEHSKEHDPNVKYQTEDGTQKYYKGYKPWRARYNKAGMVETWYKNFTGVTVPKTSLYRRIYRWFKKWFRTILYYPPGKYGGKLYKTRPIYRFMSVRARYMLQGKEKTK